jgi:hypothetical protein
MGGFAGVTTAISLLAGFRLNSSYRDLARDVMMWMKDKDQQNNIC